MSWVVGRDSEDWLDDEEDSDEEELDEEDELEGAFRFSSDDSLGGHRELDDSRRLIGAGNMVRAPTYPGIQVVHQIRDTVASTSLSR